MSGVKSRRESSKTGGQEVSLLPCRDLHTDVIFAVSGTHPDYNQLVVKSLYIYIYI